LGDLCTKWGFCGNAAGGASERLAEIDRIDVDTFSVIVLEAEGLNPELELSWRRRIKRWFIDVFGRDEVSFSDDEV